MSTNYLNEDKIIALLKKTQAIVAGTANVSSGTIQTIFYNHEYVSNVTASIISNSDDKGIRIIVGYKNSTLASRYKNLLCITPFLSENVNVSDENYLSTTFKSTISGSIVVSYYIYIYDTNNGANLRQSNYISFLIPNINDFNELLSNN